MAVKLFKALRHELMEAEMTMEQLARQAGLDHTVMSRRFCGKTEWSLGEMYAVMRVLKLDAKDLHYYFPEGGKSKEFWTSRRKEDV